MNQTIVKRTRSNSIWLGLARVCAQLLSILFTVLVARRFGESGLGQYAFIAALIYLGNVLTTFGLDTLLIREIARTRQPTTALIPAALWIQTTLAIGFIGALYLFGNSLAWVYGLSLLPLVFYTIYSALLRAFERMDLYLLLNLVSSLLPTACIVLVTIAQASLTTLIVQLVLSQVITALFAASLCRAIPNFKLDWKMDWASMASVLRAAFPFALLTTLAILYQRMGIFALATFEDNHTVGWFSAASRVIEAAKLAPQAILGALFPVLAYAFGDPARQLIRSAQTITLLLIALASVVCLVLAQPIIGLVYGQQFEPSIPALQILTVSLIPYTFTATVTLALVVGGHEWLVLRGTFAAVVIAILLFALCVPRFGLLGASWATVAAEWIQAGLFWRLYHHARTQAK